MTKKVIPISVLRRPAALTSMPAPSRADVAATVDRHARPLRDLRISVTDRCNFRCIYCMPAETFGKDYAFLPQTSLLSFEEITRVARLFISRGVTKIRLTGGEPLLRKNIEQLIGMLAALRTPEGKELDLALTTNGSLLAKKARALKDAGLKRVTVSLDAIDDAPFRKMNAVDFSVADVLRGIDAAHEAGLDPIKVNMVVKAGMNDQQILPMARHFKDSPFFLRFIEYMDVGTSNGWKMDEVVPSSEVIRRIDAVFPVKPIDSSHPSETATRWRYRDGVGEIGVISSVTHAFCGDCTRARLSTEGMLYTCLFAAAGHDLRALLRQSWSDEEISSVIANIWTERGDQYSELRSRSAPGAQSGKKIEMSYIGG